MSEILTRLKRARLTMMLANLAYFLALLCLGYLILIKGKGGVFYLLAIACVVVYIFGVRPLTARYKHTVRSTLLHQTVCRGLTDVAYEPKRGITAEEFRASGLMPGYADRAFLSREWVSAEKENYHLEMADVTFPIRENNLNAMLNGIYLNVSNANAAFPEITVQAGEIGEENLPLAAKKLLKEMTEFIPGNLFLRTGDDGMHLLLRSRFVCFPVNPLMNITEKTIETNPLPEVQQAIRLAQLLTMQG